jgi:hypothetical protein
LRPSGWLVQQPPASFWPHTSCKIRAPWPGRPRCRPNNTVWSKLKRLISERTPHCLHHPLCIAKSLVVEICA